MKLFFRKYGKGPPLVILHGLYGSSDNWIPIAARLSDEYTVLLPDQRNHGSSPHSALHDYIYLSSDIEEFAEKNIDGPFILLGHSMGGKAAMTFALRHPELLNALIVADISPFTRSDDQSAIARSHNNILEALLKTDLSAFSSRAAIEKEISSYIGDEKVTSFIMKNLQREGKDKFAWKLNAAALCDNIDKLMETIPFSNSGESMAVGFPVLFIRAGRSNYLPESHIPDIARIFPTATFRTIEGAGHWLHAEEPAKFTQMVKDFLGGDY
ncbi:MAG: alpha/beta fold hydrolase [Bacteroidales bacterium]|jgi:pimeloyl-ACP methyl ester carboxylesterase|nr:alpha/beta fold hydrolase [Bacteroidales bacterium]